MFIVRMKWIVLGIVGFAAGVIFTVQWIGTDYGMKLWDLVKRPDVVEKIVEVEVVKVYTISDNKNIQMINQEYRDALLKISAIEYNGNQAKKTHNIIQGHAIKALSIPETLSKVE
jgi:hypothetical protein